MLGACHCSVQPLRCHYAAQQRLPPSTSCLASTFRSTALGPLQQNPTRHPVKMTLVSVIMHRAVRGWQPSQRQLQNNANGQGPHRLVCHPACNTCNTQQQQSGCQWHGGSSNRGGGGERGGVPNGSRLSVVSMQRGAARLPSLPWAYNGHRSFHEGTRGQPRGQVRQHSKGQASVQLGSRLASSTAVSDIDCCSQERQCVMDSPQAGSCLRPVFVDCATWLVGTPCHPRAP
jgi:hypothetical protein